MSIVIALKIYQAFLSLILAPGSNALVVFKNNLPFELYEYQPRLDFLCKINNE